MLTENRFAVKGAEIWVYDIKVGNRYQKTLLAQKESIVYCDIRFSASVMAGKKRKSFEFQRKSPPFLIISLPGGEGGLCEANDG